MAANEKPESVKKLEKRIIAAIVYAVVFGGSAMVLLAQLSEWRAGRYDELLMLQLGVQLALVPALLFFRSVSTRAILVGGDLLIASCITLLHYGPSMSVGLLIFACSFVCLVFVGRRAAAISVALTILLFAVAGIFHSGAGGSSAIWKSGGPIDATAWRQTAFSSSVLIVSLLVVIAVMHQGVLRAAREAHDALERERKEREERRIAELALAEAQRQEIVSRIAAGAAHDINNVMTAVMGSAELAAMELDDPAQVNEYLTLISDSAGRASSMARELLSFAKRQVTQRKSLDLAEVVSGLRALIERLSPSNIEIDIEAAPGGRTTIFADSAQIEQIILNLCVNARDAMQSGGRLRLCVSPAPASEGAQMVEVSVADTGIGIPDDVKARMFEPFFTTKEEGRGTGLGLATVRTIVDSYAGEIECRSRPGEGTTMIVRLPFAEASKKGSVAPESATEDLLSRAESVLVCDDDAIIRRTARRILEGAGYRVREAQDGPSARNIAKGERFDLVLVDAVMPGMSGRTLYEELRVAQPDLHFLFCTGHDPGVFGTEFFDDPRHYLLTKPYGRNVLLKAARLAIDGPISDRPTPAFTQEPSPSM